MKLVSEYVDRAVFMSLIIIRSEPRIL